MNNKKTKFILWFDELGIEDVPLVGGKNASLGEMYRILVPKGVSIPNGFAVTAYAYHYLVEKAGIKSHIQNILKGLDTHHVADLAERGHKVREIIRNADFPQELAVEIIAAYQKMCKQYGQRTDVAVRSSATAEDLPDASFAGQQETYLNIRGDNELINACKNCFASLFTNRAISYRVDKGFDHFSIGLSIGVQKMVRSDKACSGVMFSIDTETGFQNAVFVTAAYGLGETVVQGAVNPDEYYVFKPTLKTGHKAILSKTVGAKKIKMIYSDKVQQTTKTVVVPDEDRKKYVLTNDEILTLAKWACIIEDHYSKKAGHFKPMDMEWAKDGVTKQLFIVQARPETVHSQHDVTKLTEYKLGKTGKVVVAGKAVGELIGQGNAAIIKDVKDISQFKKGQVLVTEMTDPDWEPIMKIASAIVTNSGGRTCFPQGTKLLTNHGFINIEEIYENFENFEVPSLNRNTLKVEWKPVIASMKKQASVIEIATSLSGRMQGNSLRLTPDHKMLTFENAELQGKEVAKLIEEQQMLLCAQKIPAITESTEKERALAYLLGAISTDGSIYTSRTHGEVQFIQKETEEKKEFIDHVHTCMQKTYNKNFKKCIKHTSDGEIRGKPAVGNANAYRCYSKEIAYALLQEQQTITQTLLKADEAVIYSFLAGVIDGDGSLSANKNRINIYCSKEYLLQAIVVSCLRVGIVPQVTVNRSIWNVQIVEKLDEIFKWTKRVKGNGMRKRVGTRFFSARQLFGSSGIIMHFSTSLSQNLLIDAEKIMPEIKGKIDEQWQQKIKKILDSDTRMQRVSFNKHCGEQEVYNITVADNHNYIVFTERYTPVLVNNCHAAIVSRELGVPCVVGTNNGTEKIKKGQKVTVDCSGGDDGIVYEGLLPIKITTIDLKKVPHTKTKIMMNLAAPEQAFEKSFLPNSGVGLARQEFIINSFIKVHPKALIHFKELKDEKLKAQIQEITANYDDKAEFFIDKLSQGIATIAAAFYPKDVIVRMSDFKSNEYANLIGGHLYEPKEDNPMIGWRGASRYYTEYREAFELECKAIRRVRETIGLTNVKVMIPFCRTLEEGRKVIDVMKKQGLVQGKDGLQVYVMCEIPANVILAEEFLEIFDGFSIGSNDLTQLTLGVDRDSALVAHVYQESNEAVKLLIQRVVHVANKMHKHIGFCGQAPSDSIDFAKFLVECGIESISLNPDSVLKTTMAIAELEKKL